MAIVYRHIRLDSNQPFYIGIGRDEKRAYELIGRNKHWKRIVKKYGYKVHIMLDDLTWEQAQEKEREFIQLYGRKDLGKGGLVNLTDGGDGTLGRKHTKEAIAKMSAIKKGKPLSEDWKANVSKGLRGKPLSEETKAKISIAGKGKPKSEEWKAKMSIIKTGRKLTDEHIKKSVEAKKANKLKRLNGEL